MNTCSYCTRDAAVMSTAEGERICMDCSTAAERDELRRWRDELAGLQQSVDSDAAQRGAADEDEQHERDELQARQDWQQAQRLWNERRWAALRTAAARRRQGQQRVD